MKPSERIEKLAQEDGARFDIEPAHSTYTKAIIQYLDEVDAHNAEETKASQDESKEPFKWDGTILPEGHPNNGRFTVPKESDTPKREEECYNGNHNWDYIPGRNAMECKRCKTIIDQDNPPKPTTQEKKDPKVIGTFFGFNIYADPGLEKQEWHMKILKERLNGQPTASTTPVSYAGCAHTGACDCGKELDPEKTTRCICGRWYYDGHIHHAPHETPTKTCTCPHCDLWRCDHRKV